MNDMIVKSVDVLGSSIMAAKDNEGVIWVGIKWMCQAMGMSEGQYKRQISNIQKDLLLKNSGSNLLLNKGSGEREVFCLKLDYLPLWLAKISITPTIQKENPELADKLLDYQLKAKDILAAAFLPKQDSADGAEKDPMKLLKLHYEALEQVDKKVDVVDEKVGKLENRLVDLEETMTLDYGQQRVLEKTVNKTVTDILGGKDSNAYKKISRKVFPECNRDLKDYFKVNARANVPKKRFTEAVKYAENWKPCTNTLMLIEQYNCQQSFDFGGGAGE